MERNNIKSKLPCFNSKSKILNNPHETPTDETPPEKSIKSHSTCSITDLSITDKQRILNLIDALAQTNEEKNKLEDQIKNQQNQNESLKFEIEKINQEHQTQITKLQKKINELEIKYNKIDEIKNCEVTLLKSQHEIDIKKLKYGNLLESQELQTKIRNEFEYQKQRFETHIEKLKKEIEDLQKFKKMYYEINDEAKRLKEMHKKEKDSFEEKMSDYKLKLKYAVEVIQKLKFKLNHEFEKKNNIEHQITQTVLTTMKKTDPNTDKNENLKQTQNQENENKPPSEDALLSQIFFHHDSLTDIFDTSPFFPFQQNGGTDGKWLRKKSFF